MTAAVELPQITMTASFEPTRGPNAPKAPNPYEPLVAELIESLSPAGYSPNMVFTVASVDEAKLHRRLFRQAANAAGGHNTKVKFKAGPDGVAVTAGIVPASARRARHEAASVITLPDDAVGVIAPEAANIDF